MTQYKPSHFDHLGKMIGARFIGTVMTAVAGSIALVALSLALYALLLNYLSIAASWAATAAAFAAICGLLAIVAPKLIAGSAKRAPPTLASTLNPATLSLGVELALAIVAGFVEGARRRRRH